MADTVSHGEVLRFARSLGSGAAEPPPALPEVDALVRLHRLAPLAFRCGAERFRNDFATAAARAQAHELRARKAIAALRAVAIPVAPIKGLAYGQGLYGDLAERPMVDVDLLVSPQHYRAALGALEAIGFRPYMLSRWRHAVGLRGVDGMIDLHRGARAPLAEAIDHDAVWRRARPLEGWDGAFELDATDTLLFHCVDLSRDSFRAPLICYVDAMRLLARIDESEVRSRARDYRLRRPVDAALDAFERFRRAPAESLRALLAGESPGRAQRLLHQLRMVDGPRQLAGMAISRVLEYAGRERW